MLDSPARVENHDRHVAVTYVHRHTASPPSPLSYTKM